jgi:hypothetical protein
MCKKLNVQDSMVLWSIYRRDVKRRGVLLQGQELLDHYKTLDKTMAFVYGGIGLNLSQRSMIAEGGHYMYQYMKKEGFYNDI